MANLKVPDSPTTYTTHYENLLGIDCFTPNTEISNSHAAEMVNMLPDGAGLMPVKRKGWRKLQEFNTNITTAYYDVYNDDTYVATEDEIAIKGGNFDVIETSTVVDADITKGDNISFKLPHLDIVEGEPSDYLKSMTIKIEGNSTIAERRLTTEQLQYFHFDENGNVYISESDLRQISNPKHLVYKDCTASTATTYTVPEFNIVQNCIPHTNLPTFMPRYLTVGSTPAKNSGEYNTIFKLRDDYSSRLGRYYIWGNDGYEFIGNSIDFLNNINLVFETRGDGATLVTKDTLSFIAGDMQWGDASQPTHYKYQNGTDTRLYFRLSDEMAQQTEMIDGTYVRRLICNGIGAYRFGYRRQSLTSAENCQFTIFIEDDYENYNITITATYAQHTELSTITTSAPVKHIIPFNGKIYFFASDGIHTLEDGVYTSIDRHVPLTRYSMSPDGTGGSAYYGINALWSKQQYQYHGDGTTKTYVFHPTGTYITLIEKVELFNGVSWSETSAYTVNNGGTYTVLNEAGTSTTSVTSATGVTFTTAPAKYDIGDNVRFTVWELDPTIKSGTTRYGYYRQLYHDLLNADILTLYGSVDTDRLFVVVDGNKIYYSEAGDLSYFPDDNYIVAGNYAPIVGLHRKDDYLIAVTGESDSHAVYLIKSSTAVVTEQDLQSDGTFNNTSREEQFFSVHPAASGKGAVATKSFSTLIDDPLYLGTQGVYSISSNYYTSQTMIINKSTFINPKLLAEPSLQNAISCIWKHFYCIFINGHVYLFDSNNTTRDSAGNRCYEAYYLENIPVTNCVLPAGDTLYFANGKWLCKFNTDIKGNDAYYDDGTYEEDFKIISGDVPVHCKYVTKLDDDNYPQYFKNLNKKGCVITVLAYDASSADVYVSKNGEEYIQTPKMANVETDDITIDIFTLKKVKKYKRLRFMITNDRAEPFGLVKIVKTWTLGNYAK